jgi:predicted ATPase
MRTETILTPDQRVRVFISSTMEELAAERAAVRRAVERLRLVPVLFEMGARSHPPRSLYRSYLEQSHVFVAIYWQRYGWIAPGMDVSGLEDEYLLAGAKPKLVYVKRSDKREDRLNAMLDRIRARGDVSYKAFSTVDEIEQLVTDDLALLLSESLIAPPAPAPRADVALPADSSPFVGRDQELADVGALMNHDDVRLVTLTGFGGIGKTRLALRAAADIAPQFETGAAFVPLTSLRDSELVPSAIAHAVGLRDVPKDALVETLKADLADRSLLLVVDNFEHVLPAAGLLPDLLGAARAMKILATSREALRVRAEHEFAVGPLDPSDGIRLFADRAAAVRPGFRLDDMNATMVARICERLERVPLAIELAAARARLLSLDALLERLDRRLDFLVGGARDLPDRQQALRATIQWSYDLLDDDERRAFEALGVFVAGFTLRAAEMVLSVVSEHDPLELMASLVDKSLLRADIEESEPRFRMLSMIAEFARERLDESVARDQVRNQFAGFYREFSAAAGLGTRGPEQRRWLAMLERNGEADNVRAALDWLLSRHRLDEYVEMGWSLWVPAWISGRVEEGRRMAHAALTAPDAMSDQSRARLMMIAGIFDMWRGEHTEAAAHLDAAIAAARQLGDNEVVAYAMLARSMTAGPGEGEEIAEKLGTECVALCRALGDRWAEAAALNMLGWLYVAQERFEEPNAIFDETFAIAELVGDEHFMALAEVNLAEARLHAGTADEARALLASAARRLQAAGLRYPAPYVLDAAARLAAHEDDLERAATLIGASDRLRDTMSISVWGSQAERRSRFVEAMRRDLGAAACAERLEQGAALTFDDAIGMVAHN